MVVVCKEASCQMGSSEYGIVSMTLFQGYYQVGNSKLYAVLFQRSILEKVVISHFKGVVIT
jgi:hypothetical protein